jgi:carbon storage regulator CsrA
MEVMTMLVLSRKIGEAIHIDGDIVVVVTAIDSNRVSLGIVAPKTVGIRRSELPLLPSMPRLSTIPIAEIP